MQYCSLQHRNLLPSPVTSITGCCFCFGSVSSFFLELFFRLSPVTYWAPTDLGNSSFSVLTWVCQVMVYLYFVSEFIIIICRCGLRAGSATWGRRWTQLPRDPPPLPLQSHFPGGPGTGVSPEWGGSLFRCAGQGSARPSSGMRAAAAL